MKNCLSIWTRFNMSIKNKKCNRKSTKLNSFFSKKNKISNQIVPWEVDRLKKYHKNNQKDHHQVIFQSQTLDQKRTYQQSQNNHKSKTLCLCKNL